MFRKGQDSIHIVHDAEGRENLKGAFSIAECAASSFNTFEWLEKVIGEGVGNKHNRLALKATRTIIEKCSRDIKIKDEELFEFLKHIKFQSCDLKQEDTPEHTNLLNLIKAHFKGTPYLQDASAIWAMLVNVCMEQNRVGGYLDLANLSRVLDDKLCRIFTQIREWQLNPNDLLPYTVSARHASPPSTITYRPSDSWGRAERLDPDSLPSARQSSPNPFASKQLDLAETKIRDAQYQDALEVLKILASDMSTLDQHQCGRWFIMRANCNWNLHRDPTAADDYINAANYCNDDDKIVAAGIRGWLLKEDIVTAEHKSREAIARFPESINVWVMAKNVDINKGIVLQEENIPLRFRDSPDPFLIVAASMARNGNLEHATKLSLKALRLSPESFHARDYALSCILERLNRNFLSVAFQMLTPEERDDLMFVTDKFEPHSKKLWSIQSKAFLPGTISNLAIAYLMLGRAGDTLNLIRQAKEFDLIVPGESRIILEAYRALEQPTLALDATRSTIDTMKPDELISFSQIAAELVSIDDIQLAFEKAKLLDAEATETADTIKTLFWQALLSSNRIDEVKGDLEAFDLKSSTSIVVLAQAHQAWCRIGCLQPANECIERILFLLPTRPEQPDRYLAAKALLLAKRYKESVEILQALVKTGSFTDLHNDLLYCYIKLGALRKARRLIDTFPQSWMENDFARALAIEMAQEAGDNDLLSALCDAQLKKAPKQANSWIFKIMLANKRSNENLWAFVGEIPEVLEGTTKEIAKIANFEASNGHESNGLKRLYRLRRSDLTNVDIAAAYLFLHFSTRKLGSLVDQSFASIGPGTAFSIEDQSGKRMRFIIDPVGMEDLMASGDFRTVSSTDLNSFLGKSVGDFVSINQTFDNAPKIFEIKSITTAYRAMLELSHQHFHNSLSPSSFMTAIAFPDDENGNPDFAILHDQIKRRAHVSHGIIEAYRDSPLTIGTVSRLLNKSVYETIMGWPTHDVLLDVGGANLKERETVLESLKAQHAPFVIDAATLIEMAQAECLDHLRLLPTLYCTTFTYEMIKHELSQTVNDYAEGFAADVHGSLVYIENTEAEKHKKICFFEHLIRFLHTHCHIYPSYGPDEESILDTNIKNVLSMEELATVRLCIERNAALLSMDARLRMLAHHFHIEGVWPQAVLQHLLSQGKLQQASYSHATVKMFLAGRHFISISASNIFFAILQGSPWIDALLPRVREHFCSIDVDFVTAKQVYIELLNVLSDASLCQSGFFFEIAIYLLEGLARHPHCPLSFADELKVWFFLKIEVNHPSHSAMFSWFFTAVDGLFGRKNSPFTSDKLHGRVLYGTRLPLLVSGMTEDYLTQLITTKPDDTPPTSEDEGMSTMEAQPSFNP